MSIWGIACAANTRIPNPSDAGGVDRTYTPGAEIVFNAEAGYSPMDRLLVALKYESIIGSEYGHHKPTPQQVAR